MTSKRLRTKWVSQNGTGATYGIGDCGYACLDMIAETLGVPMTVDDWGRLANQPPKYTQAGVLEIQRTARHKGIVLDYENHVSPQDIRRSIDQQQPVIVLVHYPRLDHRRLHGYQGGHFILVHGYDDLAFYYDDPEWLERRDGEDIAIYHWKLRRAMESTGKHFKIPGQALFLRSHTVPTSPLSQP